MASAQRLEEHDLERRRTERAVAGRQQALAEVGAENRIPWRPNVHGNSEAGNRIPQAVAGLVTAPGLIQEQVESVLLEDVQRVRPARHRQLAEADARRGDTVDPGVVEQPELILRKAIQVAPAEPGRVQVKLLKGADIEIARHVHLVLL